MELPIINEDWTTAYANYADELHAFVSGRVDDGEEEDLLQEVWAAFAYTLEEQTITEVRGWLYRTTRNRITDLYRRSSGRPAFQDLSPELDAEDTATEYPDPDEAWAQIDAALAQLPPDQREVFVRNELDDETLREIALDLGVPLKTVISRKGYARRRLQEQLWGLYEEYFGAD